MGRRAGLHADRAGAGGNLRASEKGKRETVNDPENTALDLLLRAQRALRARWEDFRRALDRRDEEAYRMALADFHQCLARWTQAEEKILVKAMARITIPGRDPERELRLELVQIRELTRYLLSEIKGRAPLADILGLTSNLERRLAAHETEMERVYSPAAANALTAEELKILLKELAVLSIGMPGGDS